MLGISLPFEFLLGYHSSEREKELLDFYGSIEGCLKGLKEEGIGSVELRKVKADADPEDTLQAVKTIWKSGLAVSVHGELYKSQDEGRFLTIYRSLQKVMRVLTDYQSSLVMTVHSFTSQEGSLDELSDKTVQELKKWSSRVESDNLPIYFALENNRKKARVDPSTECEKVLDMVEKIGHPRVGTCWDFGHYYYNLLHYEGESQKLPPFEFAQKVIHTHIHGVGTGTHEPLLSRESLPLDAYLGWLKKAKYKGVANIELEFARFPNAIETRDGILRSVIALQACESRQL